MNEPRRLRDGDELPASVRDALGALGQGAARPDSVLRIQRALEELNKSAPCVETSLAGGGGAGAGLSVTTLVTSAVTIIATATLVAVRLWSSAGEAAPQGVANSLPGLEAPRLSSSQPTHVPSAAPARSEDEGLARSGPEQTPPERVVSDTAGPSAAVQTFVAKPASVWPRSRRKERTPLAQEAARSADAYAETSASGAAVAVAGPETASSSSLGASHVQDAREAVVVREVALPEASTTPAVEPAPRESREAVPALEAASLSRVKRVAQQDAGAALQLLTAHVARFPNGAFTEEREVLAIRLHTQLGHIAQAKLLTAAFRARFPHSMYRSSLPP